MKYELEKWIKIESFQIDEYRHHRSLVLSLAYASRDSHSKKEKYRRLLNEN